MHNVVSTQQDGSANSDANADVAALEARLKQARIDLAIAEGKASCAITEAKRWHGMYEHAVKPEIKLVEGNDEELARAYVDAQDKCDLLEERIVKILIQKDACLRTIRRQNSYLRGIKQRTRGISIDEIPPSMAKDPDMDSCRREGWLDMDDKFKKYRINHKEARRQAYRK